jgi:hypothetical protein
MPTPPLDTSREAVERKRARGVLLVFIDEKGHAIAHAADFDPQTYGGFTLIEGQRHRAKRALSFAVANAYASPNFVRGMDDYDCERVMERLRRAHGCTVHEVAIGHAEPQP